VLEQVRKTGPPGGLVARANVVADVDHHERLGVVLVEDHRQSVRQPVPCEGYGELVTHRGGGVAARPLGSSGGWGRIDSSGPRNRLGTGEGGGHGAGDEPQNPRGDAPPKMSSKVPGMHGNRIIRRG
jgi:hypothetical protein